MIRKLCNATGVATTLMFAFATAASAMPIGLRPTLFSVAAPNAAGSAGDILTPGDAGVTPDAVNVPSGLPPQVAIHEGVGGGFATNGLGLPVGLQVDAFSRGDDMDRQIPAGIHGVAPGAIYSWLFSVDTAAVGKSGGVLSEAAGDGASADVYVSEVKVDGAPGNAVVTQTPDKNALGYDGDGSLGAPSMGLTENEDVDAIDISYASHPGVDVLGGPSYFSLDSTSAATPGFAGLGVGTSGADLFSSTGGVISTFATHTALGLAAGDDLDALVIADNGNGTFDAASQFFDWTDESADMVLFSLAPGSPTLGTDDVVRDLAIEPGDILTFVTGPIPGVAIFIPAEDLGLLTVRSGDASSDNLNALDVVPEPAAIIMGLMGLAALGMIGWRRSKR